MATSSQMLSYERKIDSEIYISEFCEIVLENYTPWAAQREETIKSLRNVEKTLNDIATKCHPVLKPTDTEDFTLSSFLLKLLRPDFKFAEERKKARLDLISEFEENRSRALEMCARDLSLLHELAVGEFYAQLTNTTNGIFGDNVLLEILDDILELFKNIPEEVENVANISSLLQIWVESILPKTKKIVSNGFSISCIGLSVFLAIFMSHQHILTLGQDLGLLSSAETEIAKLISAARMKDSKLEKMVSLEMKEKITLGNVKNVTIELATIVLNSIDAFGGFLPPEMRLLGEITNKLERDLISFKETLPMFEKSPKERLRILDITNWTTVIIYHVPEGAGESAIKDAVKRFLRERAQDCIVLKRLPTNGNHWLVKVPTRYSLALIREERIDIAEENCLIMP